LPVALVGLHRHGEEANAQCGATTDLLQQGSCGVQQKPGEANTKNKWHDGLCRRPGVSFTADIASRSLVGLVVYSNLAERSHYLPKLDAALIE